MGITWQDWIARYYRREKDIAVGIGFNMALIGDF
jgi:hypothetical protein